jgi:prepilin-type N-terminal cleavage/methylation domain-containing protein
MQLFPSQRRRTAGGFTLVELLVVIGIIALLVGILLPTLSKARASATRVQCGSNIRQIMMAFTAYAGEFKGRYPQTGPEGVSPSGPYWAAPDIFLWNITVADYLEKRIVKTTPPNVFFCPGMIHDRSDWYDKWWKPGYGPGPIWRGAGYASFTTAALSDTLMPGRNWFKLDPEQPDKNKPPRYANMHVVRQGQKGRRMMIVDMVRVGTDFPFPGTAKNLWFSGHWARGKVDGGNIGYTDGSVVWKNYSDMKRSYAWDAVVSYYW